MKLSIITINKNNAAGLEKTIQSVICQTSSNFEYIVINRVPDDNSVEIIKKYADKINFGVSEPDTGIYNAMNKGIKKAQGEYCLFLNSGDCLVSSETLNNVFIEMGDNSTPIFFSNRINSDGTIISYPNNLSINYLLDNTISYQNVLIKHSLFDEHGYFNEDLITSSDWEFFLKESWIHKTAFVHLKTNISIVDIDSNSSQNAQECFIDNMTVYQNVFRELSETIIEVVNYRRTTYHDIIDNYSTEKLLRLLFYLFNFIILNTKKFKSNIKKIKIIKKILSNCKKYILLLNANINANIRKIICYLYEMITSIFDKRMRMCFTHFSDIPQYFFLIPAFSALKLHHCPYKIVKYYKPHIQFFSVFGRKNKLIKSKALCKIFYTGENTNHIIDNENYKGNCIEYVSLSFGFDYTEDVNNYFRFPLWLTYYFLSDDSKDKIIQKLNAFKKQYQKYKFCALVASHDRSGIRTKIYNEVSKIGPVDCPASLLHNDDTLHKRYANNKAVYLQQYKFNICPENSISPGYVTEKLFQALYSGCIPIYNGWDKNVEPDIVNPNIIFWYDTADENNNILLFNEIKKMNSNDKLYRSFIDQSFFCDTAVDKIYFLLQQFNEKIQHTVSESLKNHL